MPKLILHIGGGKTGSSYLQYCFAAHKNQFAGLNVYYPDHSDQELASKGHVTSGNGLAMSRLLTSEISTVEEEIDAYVTSLLIKANGSDVLLSSEAMQALKAKNLQRLKECSIRQGYRLLVVYYVRSVAGRAMSTVRQTTKRHLETRSFNEIVPVYRYPAAGVVRVLSDSLPTEMFMVRNYDYAKTDLYADFACSALPPGAEQIKIKTKKVNPSLTHYHTEYMRLMNRHLKSERQAVFVGHVLAESAKQEVDAERFIITRDQADKLEILCASDVEFVNRFLPEEQKVEIIGPGEIVGDPPDLEMTEFEEASLVLIAALVNRVLS